MSVPVAFYTGSEYADRCQPHEVSHAGGDAIRAWFLQWREANPTTEGFYMCGPCMRAVKELARREIREAW